MKRANKDPKFSLSLMVGARMREARVMNRLSLDRAALKMGYKNDAQLSKIENSVDGRLPALFTVVSAARLYGVSVDWLCGLVDDFDPDENHDRTAQMVEHFFDVMSVTRRVEIRTVCGLSRKVTRMEKAVAAMLEAADEACRLMPANRKNIPSKDDMDFNLFFSKITALASIARGVKMMLNDFSKGEPPQIRVGPPPLPWQTSVDDYGETD